MDVPIPILRATEEVVEGIKRFTDTPIAKELLMLFHYRMLDETDQLKDDAKYSKYDDEYEFIQAELIGLPSLIERLNYENNKMIQEINFLYYASSIGYYKEIEKKLIEYVNILEAIGESENALLQEINRKANTGEIVRYERGERLIKEYQREHQDKWFLKFDESNLIDYLDFFNSQVSRFKKNISRYVFGIADKKRLQDTVPEKGNAIDKQRIQPPVSDKIKAFESYGLDEFKYLFEDGKYEEFIKVCDVLTQTLGAGKDRKIFRYPIVEKRDDKYSWKGLKIGAHGERAKTAESLGHFIQVLTDKNYLKSMRVLPIINDKRKLARIFIGYFHPKLSNPKSLSQEIKLHEHLEQYFAFIK